MEQQLPIVGMLSEIDGARTASVKHQYGYAVEQAGGLPLLLPFVQEDAAIERFVQLCDGFLFTGGADIHPQRYGEEKQDVCGEVQLYRDELEFKVLKKALQSGKPIFAICRGMQLVNVAFGGTLYQDLPDAMKINISHKQSQDLTTDTHEIQVYENTPLHTIIQKTSMCINSLHHQGVKRLGEGLKVMAMASDGAIEAIYAPEYAYLRAYQWHPEWLFDACQDNRLIFQDFIRACKSK